MQARPTQRPGKEWRRPNSPILQDLHRSNSNTTTAGARLLPNQLIQRAGFCVCHLDPLLLRFVSPLSFSWAGRFKRLHVISDFDTFAAK